MQTHKHIIMTGATGLIGTSLFRELLLRGYRVTVLTRHPQRAKLQLPGADRTLLWAPGIAGEWQRVLNGVDAVIHLAGESIGAKRWSEPFKQHLIESRVMGTRSIVEAISQTRHKPAVFISSSAVGYYGDTSETPVDEASSAGTDFLSRICIAWEHEAFEASAHDIRVVTVRTAVALDAHDGALPRMLTPIKYFVGGSFGDGRQWFPWIHLKDLVRIYLYVLETETLYGAVNAVAPGHVRNREFIRQLARTVKRPAWLTVPGFLLRLVVGGFAETLLGGQKVIPKKLSESGFQFHFETLADALNDVLS